VTKWTARTASITCTIQLSRTLEIGFYVQVSLDYCYEIDKHFKSFKS